MRVVLDTNVVASRFLSPTGAPALLFALWEAGEFELAVTEPVLAEYRQVLSYQHIQRRHQMDAGEVNAAIEALRQFGVLVATEGNVRVVKEDPEDDKFLECAVAGEADFLISGDSHLLDLREYGGIQILSPRMFLEMLKQVR